MHRVFDKLSLVLLILMNLMTLPFTAFEIAYFLFFLSFEPFSFLWAVPLLLLSDLMMLLLWAWARFSGWESIGLTRWRPLLITWAVCSSLNFGMIGAAIIWPNIMPWPEF